MASILFRDPAAEAGQAAPVPACFADLGLEHIVDSVVSGRDEYRLSSFFRQPLEDEDAVAYRQEVFADLDGTALCEQAETFAGRMRSVRELLARTAETQHRYQGRSWTAEMQHPYQRRAWMLEAAGTYIEAVTELSADLNQAPITSRALLGLRDHVSGYVGSDAFRALAQDMTAARQALGDVRYTLLFYATVIRVHRFEDEPDYGAEISAFFGRFRPQDGGDHRVPQEAPATMNRIEEQVLDRVVTLFPDAFGALDRFCEAHPAWLDERVARFDREVQFYLAGLELVRRLRAAGLPVCYPAVSSTSKAETVSSTYDLALALRHLAAPDGPVTGNGAVTASVVNTPEGVVTNDYTLSGPERIIVVTGPNQGGKTTFARTFGQLHWLASLGWPVPGSQARLFLADGVLCHFERGENLADMRGKLEDDLVRIHEILVQATDRSVVILNEIFSSTTLRDATVLSRAILGALSALDLLGVCVTFVDELASFDHKTVSMVAGVDPADPTVRTFKLERRPADGRAYAVVLAERYGLSYDRIKERLAR